jgi:hypothetical protein
MFPVMAGGARAAFGLAGVLLSRFLTPRIVRRPFSVRRERDGSLIIQKESVMANHVQSAPSALVVSDISVRQDHEGRYCLNDLHRSAGGESRHQPAFFMRRKETEDLVAEIINSANSQSLPVHQVEGRKGGTYVCRELVYAYGMWISPAFHLKVIRAYDALVTARISSESATSANPQVPPSQSPHLPALLSAWSARYGSARKSAGDVIRDLAENPASDLAQVALGSVGAADCIKREPRLYTAPRRRYSSHAPALLGAGRENPSLRKACKRLFPCALFLRPRSKFMTAVRGQPSGWPVPLRAGFSPRVSSVAHSP